MSQYHSLKGSIIFVEGLIGAGKSTLCVSLQKMLTDLGYSVRYYDEFVDTDLLAEYLGDMKRYAYLFQSIMIRKKIGVYRSAMTYVDDGGIAIIDRSIYGDMAFATMQHDDGMISDADYEQYMKMCGHIDIYCSWICIGLQCHPKVAYDRMILRNRDTESYDLAYFEKLDKYYWSSLSRFNDKYVLLLDWNQPRPINDGYINSITCSEILSTCCNIIEKK